MAPFYFASIVRGMKRLYIGGDRMDRKHPRRGREKFNDDIDF